MEVLRSAQDFQTGRALATCLA